MKIKFQEHSIDDIFRYFVDGFKLPNSDEKIVNWEPNYDLRTGKVIFKLCIEEKPQSPLYKS